MSVRCIFCLTEQEPSDEHVVPESIGGSLVIKQVCKQCNSQLSSIVDDPFAKTIYVEMARFAHQIGGKRNKVPNPLAGPAETADKKKVLLSKDLKPYLIRHVEETAEDDAVKLSIQIDASDEARLDEMIRSPLRAALSKKMVNASPDQLNQALANAIQEAKQKATKRSDKPELHYAFSIPLDDLIFEYLKIAYEMAFLHFGYDWIDKCRTSKKLREAILKRDPKARIHGQVPCNDLPADMTEPDCHHILMAHNGCHIKLFNLSGAVTFATGDTRFVIPQGKGKLVLLNYATHTMKERSLQESAAIQVGAEKRRAVLRQHGILRYT